MDMKPYGIIHTCVITKDDYTFKAELSVGNYTSSADQNYITDEEGYNYGEISDEYTSFVFNLGNVITPE
jgi:hypothetical protein